MSWPGQVVASAIIDKYIGESARVVREMFDYAKEHAPTIIFIDEIDAIGGKRQGEGQGTDREVRVSAAFSLSFVLLAAAFWVTKLVPGSVAACPCPVNEVQSCLPAQVQRTLMELLGQLDGFEALTRVKCIMATNRPDSLDDALMRPVCGCLPAH